VEFPDDVRYTREHEWAREEGEVIRVGITDFAQDALGDVVYVDVPEVGTKVTAGEPFGEVESAPLTGSVVERNDALTDQPELVNSDPYGDGWMIAIQPSDSSELETLMDASAYRAFTEESGDSQ
jgi:glycine cleavage system H protein